jgi:hypothetical protein
VGVTIDRTHVRLAELIAVLSLRIDLGFGQPMEHVLRQCLIAPRLAESFGLGEEDRASVYYTALLINVGCHTDAHEQAKWFGDDIALKSTKYDHEPKSAMAAAAGLRRLGAGNPPLHRFRLGLEFISGHREVDDMIAHHAEMTRTFGEHLGGIAPPFGGVTRTYGRRRSPSWGVRPIFVRSRIATRSGGEAAAIRTGRDATTPDPAARSNPARWRSPETVDAAEGSGR